MGDLCPKCDNPMGEFVAETYGMCWSCKVAELEGERDRYKKAILDAMETGRGDSASPCEERECGGCEDERSPLCDEYLADVIKRVHAHIEDNESLGDRLVKAEAERDAALAALNITPEQILHEIGGIPATMLDPTEDNFAIALCTYFEAHPLSPDDGDIDDETGWPEWVVEQAKDLEKRIAKAICAKLQAALQDNDS